jgi:hypothetical protein
VFCMCVATSKDGELKKGIFRELASGFSVTPSTIGRLWASTLTNIEFFLSNHDNFEEALDMGMLKFNWRNLPDEVYASRKGVTGRKQMMNRELLKERTRFIPLNKRKTYRSLSKELEISYSSVRRLLRKEKVFRRHTSETKTFGMARLEFGLSVNGSLQLDQVRIVLRVRLSGRTSR